MAETMRSSGASAQARNAARALVARYDLVYERWGLRADPLTQAMLAYTVAAAVRVDGKELSADEAIGCSGRCARTWIGSGSLSPRKHAENAAARDAPCCLLAGLLDGESTDFRGHVPEPGAL